MNYTFTFALLTAFLLLAGCAQTQAPPSGQPPAQAPTISVISAPSTAETGRPVVLKWRVGGPSTTTTHTAVHYGYASVPADPTPEKYAFKTAIRSGSIPGEFSDAVTFAQPGTVYYRAHVIVGGNHNSYRSSSSA